MNPSVADLSPNLPLTFVRISAVSSGEDQPDCSVSALTAGLVAGDETAFRDFHRLYFDRLHRFLKQVTHGDANAAQDALQETLLRVARNPRRFEDGGVFWNWLATVARNAARDGSRKHRRYRAVLERFGVFRTVDSDTPAMTDAQKAALHEAVQALAGEERELIEAKYFVGRSVTEMAQLLGMTDKAVESRLLRARRHLATLLARRSP